MRPAGSSVLGGWVRCPLPSAGSGALATLFKFSTIIAIYPGKRLMPVVGIRDAAARDASRGISMNRSGEHPRHANNWFDLATSLDPIQQLAT